MDKHEWIKYEFHGGQPAVWHMPNKDATLFRVPACGSNGPITGKIVAVQMAEILPQGKVCASCARLFMNELKRNLEESVKSELLKRKVASTVNIELEVKEETLCPNVRVVKRP